MRCTSSGETLTHHATTVAATTATRTTPPHPVAALTGPPSSGGAGGVMGDGGGGGDGMSDSLSTHLDPTPFRPGPPLHTLGWTRNVAFVPFASVSSVSTAVEHGNPASAPKEVLCPRSSFEVVKHSSHSSKQRNPVVSHESSSNSYRRPSRERQRATLRRRFPAVQRRRDEKHRRDLRARGVAIDALSVPARPAVAGRVLARRAVRHVAIRRARRRRPVARLGDVAEARAVAADESRGTRGTGGRIAAPCAALGGRTRRAGAQRARVSVAARVDEGAVVRSAVALLAGLQQAVAAHSGVSRGEALVLIRGGGGVEGANGNTR